MCLWRNCRQNVVCLRWTDGSVLRNRRAIPRQRCAVSRNWDFRIVHIIYTRGKKKPFQRLKRRKIRSKENSLKHNELRLWNLKFLTAPILTHHHWQRKHEIGNTLLEGNKEYFWIFWKKKKKIERRKNRCVKFLFLKYKSWSIFILLFYSFHFK